MKCCLVMTVATVLLWSVPPVNAQRGGGGADFAAKLKQAAEQPTPRTPDGHPDLTGNWTTGRFPGLNIGFRKSEDGKSVTVIDRDAPELDTFAQDFFKSRAADMSKRPPYKPQFRAKQRELMYTASRTDPGIHCYPVGVPRLGAPSEIVQKPNAIYLMYAAGRNVDPSGGRRIIPIGAQHKKDQDPLPDGDSIASWEGDTLVVDVVNLDSETWLDGDGDFHDEDLHVVERFTRKGNTLEYDVMIEDPTLFTGPWKPVRGFALAGTGSTVLLLNEGAHDLPDYPCVERDREHKVNNDRF